MTNIHQYNIQEKQSMCRSLDVTQELDTYWWFKVQLFEAAILPYLHQYSDLIWHFCHATDSRKLERVQ